jgi:hypothetical protein
VRAFPAGAGNGYALHLEFWRDAKILRSPSITPSAMSKAWLILGWGPTLAAAATCRFVDNVDYSGGLDDSSCEAVKHTGTAQGCCDACDACPECFRGIFHNGYCYMKGENAVPTTNAGRIACITNKSASCPAGQYINTESDTCTNCTTGMYRAVTMGVSCERCIPGQYAHNEGMGACWGAPCPSGRYSIQGAMSEEEAACNACPKGYFQPGTRATGCTICGAGFFAPSEGASKCEAGKLCEAGQYGKIDPSTGDANCKDCNAGYFSRAGAEQCSACNAGRYSDSAAAGNCTQAHNCSAGKFGPAAATSRAAAVCQGCDAGKYQPLATQTSCEWCQPGLFASSSNATACTDAGTGACRSGQSGKQGATSAGEAACSDCSAGRYSSSAAQGECKACTPGLFIPLAAQTKCDGSSVCAAGRYAQAAAKSASEAECIACPAGKHQALTGSSGCAACGTGFYSATAGAVSCEPGGSCVAGRYGTTDASSGEAECYDCPTGYANADTNAGACIACGVGEYTSSAGLSTCTAVGGSGGCSAGRFGRQGATSAGEAACSDCSAGRYSSSAAQGECKACTPGRYANTSGAAECEGTACAAGKYGRSGVASRAEIEAGGCISCAAGRHQPASGASSCLACDAGRYARAVGVSKCERGEPCAAGRFGVTSALSGNASCADCDPGFFSAEGAATCSACGAGKYASGRSTNNSCTFVEICTPGRFGLARATSAKEAACINCTPGRYQANVGELNCKACEAGKYANTSGAAACRGVACPSGRYGSNGAIAAPAGGGSACTDCTANTFQWDTGAETCIACGVGQSSARGQSACRPVSADCPAGKHAKLTSSSTVSCEECERGRARGAEGTHSYNDRWACTGCLPGRYASSAEATDCTLGATQLRDHDAGKRAVDAAGGVCPPGTKGVANAMTPADGECRICESGRHTSVAASSSCAECEPGMYSISPDKDSTDDGSSMATCTFVEVCAAGKYGVKGATSAAEAQCIACPKGRYGLGSTTGSSSSTIACRHCPAGLFAAWSGSSHCSTGAAGETAVGASGCLPGHEGPIGMSTADAAICTKCIIGKYQPQSGSRSCVDCSPGQYSDEPGFALGCRGQSCPAGYFGDAGAFVAPASSACAPCRSGQVASVGAPSCKKCDAGHYASDDHAQCDPCPSGYYQLPLHLQKENGGQGSVQCIRCPAGKYGQSWASPSCGDCEPGSSTNASAGTGTGTGAETGDGTAGGATECFLCKPGRFTPTVASLTCEACGAGLFLADEYDDSTSRKLEPKVQCRPCTCGQFSLKPVASTGCGNCSVGRYSASSSSSPSPSPSSYGCRVCPAGKFASQKGSPQCSACPPGRYSADEASTCAPCAAGRFQSKNGGTTCGDCEAGKYSGKSGGAVECKACMVGQAQPSAAAAECVACSSGRDGDGDGGEYQDQSGAVACKKCSALSCSNESSAASRRGCGGVTAGYCTSCKPGETTEGGVCVPCAAGLFGELLNCRACPIGKFQARKGQPYCDSCPGGKYSYHSYGSGIGGSNASGAVDCSPCSQGRYSQAESSACTVCESGYVGCCMM